MVTEAADLNVRVQEICTEFNDPNLTVAKQLCDRHDANAVAFTFIDSALDGTDVTFGELADRSRRFAGVLAAEGVGPGNRVASLMSKGADLPALMLGIWRLGAVYVPLFTAFAADAVTDRLERSATAVVVTDAKWRDKLTDGPWSVLVAGAGAQGGESLERRLDGTQPVDGDAPTGPEVPLVHMFTSGTTGKPKAVIHPKSYIAGWQGYLEFALGVTSSEDVFWCGADPGWAYGLYTAIIGPMVAGRRSLLTIGAFAPEATWDVLEKFEVTDFASAPTALRAMRNSDAGRPLPHLRRLSSAGEPLTPDVLEWTESIGVAVHDHFGQTEIGMSVGFPHHSAIEITPEPKSTGISFPGWTMTVLGLANDSPAVVGEIGRLALVIDSSPFFTFTGYGIDRDFRSDRFTEDGAHYLTGDLARVDKAGIFHFSSRDDDVILMAGYRIGPFEIESTLLAHPRVVEAAVVAAPDEMRGEIAHAFIVVEDLASTEGLEAELQQWVKDNYAAHAYPRRIDFVDELPKTPSGKVQRAVLRKSLATS